MKHIDSDYIAYDPCFGDEGTVSFRTVKLVTARKEHACFLGAGPYGDGHTIKPGDRYRDEKALVDGDYWGRYKVCIPCIDKWIDEVTGEAS